MTDINKTLLSKKSPYNQEIEEFQALIKKIKQQNDALQRNEDTDLDANLIKVIKQQKEKMDESLQKGKHILQELDKQAKGYDQKKQLKSLKQIYQKEIDRNKQIMNSLIKRSFESNNDDDEQDQEELEKQLKNAFPEYSKDLSINHNKVYPQMTQEEKQQMRQEVFLQDFENQLIQERQQELNGIERDAHTLHKIMGELAAKVDEQDQQLDIITEDLVSVNKQVNKAGQEILQANQRSQDAKKKYLIFAFIVFLLATVIVGSFFYFDVFNQ